MGLPSLLTNVLHRLFLVVFQGQAKQFEGIPGPQPIFPIGTLQDFINTNTAQVLGSYGEQFGGLSVMWTFGQPSLVLNDPKLIQKVLLTDEQQTDLAPNRSTSYPVSEKDFFKDLPRKALCPMLTTTSTFITAKADSEWEFLSKNHLLHANYRREWLELQIAPLKEFVESRCDEWILVHKSQEFPVYDAVQKLTFDGFALATLGRTLEKSYYQHFRTMCDSGTQRMNLSSLNNRLIREEPASAKYQQASREWYDLFRNLVGEANQDPPTNSLLALVTERGGTDFNSEQLSKVFAEAYPGGAISVPSGITNTLYLLERHPQVLSALLEELQTFWQGELTLDRLERCTKLDRALRESLRLLPPVAFFLRNVDRDRSITLAGHEIPPNTQIYMTSWHIQRRSPYWGENSETFQPERWDDRKVAEHQDYEGDYFFPFGRGDRKCIGHEFAIYFMKVALATLLPKFQFQFVLEASHTPDFIPQEFYFAVSIPSTLKAVSQPRH
ncbi:MAG: cytochrome P450 [Cyanobacteria bacterium J06639_1]